MSQLSVYSRICKGEDTAEKHKKRLKTFVPDAGSVRVLSVTEKQYAAMDILVGVAKKNGKNRRGTVGFVVIFCRE